MIRWKCIAAIAMLVAIPCASIAATSRSLPTAYTEETLCLGGSCTYASVNVWELITSDNTSPAAADPANRNNQCVNNASGWVLTIKDPTGAMPYSAGVASASIAGCTTNAEYYRCIRADSSIFHGGVLDDSTLMFEFTNSNNNGKMWGISENYFKAIDITAKLTFSGGGVPAVVTNIGLNTKLVGCGFYECVGSGGEVAALYNGVALGGTASMFNCVFANFTSANSYGVYVNANGANVSVYDSTIYGMTYGMIETVSAVIDANNVISSGNGTDKFGSGTLTNYLDTTDGVLFVDAAGNNLQLSPADTAAADQGSAVYSDDFAGRDRPYPPGGADDVGAYERYPTGGFPVIPILKHDGEKRWFATGQ